MAPIGPTDPTAPAPAPAPAPATAPAWFPVLRDWFDAAAGQVGDANAVQLATVDAARRPAVRTVLVKILDEQGIVFFTNFGSAKGRELSAAPFAEAVFAWLPLERQVRVRGPVERVSDGETLAYWRTRPRGSQLGAWASPQSQVVADRAELEARFAEQQRRFAGGDVPVPPFWGGLRIVPEQVEFWQGRPDRLHDRLLMRRDGPPGSRWITQRLAP